MRLDCGLSIVREWREADRDSLLRFANNRKVWRNLKDRFPHPYTGKDADAWFALNRANPGHMNWATRGGRPGSRRHRPHANE